MKRFSVILVAAGSTLLLSAASWRVRPASPVDTHIRSEITRLLAHFDSVDVELRARDVSHLSPGQKINRTKLIAWLRDYRDAGRFPLNDRVQDRAVPIFRDSQGTLCAMAYLVDRSGRGDIVDHIARTRNNAFIRDLTNDPALVAWLEASGLTASEAGRIQPTYEPIPIIIEDKNRVSSNYALLSMGVGGTSLGSLGFNLFAPNRVSAAAGVTAGLAAILAGGAHFRDDGGNGRVAQANVAIGSLALLGGVRAMFATRHLRSSSSPKAVSSPSATTRVSVSTTAASSPVTNQLGPRIQARF